MNKQYYVYILTNWKHTVLYVGITSHLEKRIYEHQHKLAKGFTERYNVTKLVYYEIGLDPLVAIQREKTIKNMLRSKKVALITQCNPEWTDLSVQILSDIRPPE